MEYGAITTHFDFAQLALYLFWGSFLAIVLYLLREGRREGYPLVTASGKPAPMINDGFHQPGPKTFKLTHGGTVTVPRQEVERVVAAVPSPEADSDGTPIQPTGDPLADGVGPASYAMRDDHPDLTFDDKSAKIVPLRAATEFSLSPEDPEPRGMPVVAADGVTVGKCVDAWIDKSEVILRYLEIELAATEGLGKRVLVPSTLIQIDYGRTRIKVNALLSTQFAGIPATKSPTQITLLEEDRISGYVGGGHLYATPERLGPLA